MTSLLLAVAVFASAAVPFEPVKVLSAHGIDPLKLTLTAQALPPEAPTTILVSGDYDGVPIPGVSAYKYGPLEPGMDAWRIDADPLPRDLPREPRDLKGKGLGTTLYLIAARLVRDSGRGTLISPTDGRSDDASAVWDGLVASGLAERRGIVDAVLVDDDALRRATEPSLALLRRPATAGAGRLRRRRSTR